MATKGKHITPQLEKPRKLILTMVERPNGRGVLMISDGAGAALSELEFSQLELFAAQISPAGPQLVRVLSVDLDIEPPAPIQIVKQ